MRSILWEIVFLLMLVGCGFCQWEPEVLLHRQGDRLGWFYEKVEGLGDWTGDGIDDFAVTSRSNSLDTSVIDIWWGGELLSSDPDTTICLPDSLKGSKIENTGDLTGDEIADLAMAVVVPNTGSQYIAFWRGGRGQVELIQLFQASYSDLAVPGDISGDGIPDLVLGSFNDSRVEVYLGTPEGFEGPVETIDGVGRHLGSALVAGADMNGDGWGDFACNYHLYDTLFILFHPQPGDYLSNYKIFKGDRAALVPQAYQAGRSAMALAYYNHQAGEPDFRIHLGGSNLDTIPDTVFTLDALLFSSLPYYAGDVNRDGWGDWLAGSHGNFGGLGAFMLFLGGPWMSDYYQWHGGFSGYRGEGKHLNGVGDVNGDGIDDFSVLCSRDTNGYHEYGQLLIFAGNEEWRLAVDDRPVSPLKSTVQIAAYPNPARESVQIEVLDLSPGSTVVEVYNVLGQCVWKEEVQTSGGRLNTVWRMRNVHGQQVAAGVYFIQVMQRGVSLGKQKILVTR